MSIIDLLIVLMFAIVAGIYDKSWLLWWGIIYITILFIFTPPFKQDIEND